MLMFKRKTSSAETPKPEKKRSKWSPVWRFIRNFIIFLFVFSVLAVLIIGTLLYNHAIDTMPFDYASVSTRELDYSSIIYALDEDGNPVEYDQIHGEENRLWINFDDIPQDLLNAFVAIEDERFYDHSGFDLPRTFKATYNFIFNKSSSYGGSTINQQLVKNLTGENEKSAERKIYEIFRAIDMDKHLSKDQILELYLNTIYLSQGCNGVKTAAEKYFGKEVKDLTLAECASLAGITQFPSQYDPILNPQNNKDKQEVVLMKMLDLEMITKEQYDEAVNEKLNIQNNEISKTSSQSTFADHMLNEVIADIQTELGVSETVATNMVYSGGLQIYTTLDLSVQDAIDEVYDNPSKYLSSYNPDNPVQSSIVIIDPSTGAIVGMRGELGEKEGAFTLNRATQTLRQPGSAIKPLSVYAPGFEYKKFTPNNMFVDEPLVVDGHRFRNSSGGHSGPISVKAAITVSSNIVAVKALQKVGYENSFDFMVNNLNFTSMHPNDKAAAPLACGGLTNGVSVLEMTAAYTTFANSGIYVKPYSYSKVTDKDGNVILERRKDSSVAMSDETAYSMLNCLRTVVTGGTGYGAIFSYDYYIGGKTGTTDDYKDRWFMGITPYYVGGVWFGYDIAKTINGYSSNPAMILWKNVMSRIHEGLPPKQFDAPEGVSAVRICIDSGLLASDLCSKDHRGSRVETQHMSKAVAPTETCDGHKSVQIDTTTDMIACSACPSDALETRVMFVDSNTPTCSTHGDGTVYSDAQKRKPTTGDDTTKDKTPGNNDDSAEKTDKPENATIEKQQSSEADEKTTTSSNTETKKEQGNNPTLPAPEQH